MRRFQHRSVFFVIFTIAAASSVSLLGGVGLQMVNEKLLALVPLVIALPALNTMVGDYATIIASHAGDPYKRQRTKKELAVAVSWSIILNIVGVSVLSLLLAQRNGYALDWMFVVIFAAFVAFAIVTAVVCMFAITFALDKVLENHRLNPDDVLIPVVTSLSDVIMLGLIAAAAYMLF